MWIETYGESELNLEELQFIVIIEGCVETSWKDGIDVEVYIEVGGVS